MKRATATPAPTPQIAKVGLQRLNRLRGRDDGKNLIIQMHNVIAVQTGGFQMVDDNSGVGRHVRQMRIVLQMRGAGRRVNGMSG
jgi:hypothetical protein